MEITPRVLLGSVLVAAWLAVSALALSLLALVYAGVVVLAVGACAARVWSRWEDATGERRQGDRWWWVAAVLAGDAVVLALLALSSTLP